MFRNRLPPSATVLAPSALILVLILIALSYAGSRRFEDFAIISASPIVFAASGTVLLELVWGMVLGLLAVAYLLLLTMRIRRMRVLIDEGAAELRQARERRHADVAAGKRYESELAFQVGHDNVTGLATLALLRDRFRQTSTSVDRSGCLAWVVFVDIDHFKFVNDILNHQAGDLVLRRVSEHLLSAVRESDTVARVGGDEFVLLMAESTGDVLTETILHRVMDAVAQPITIEGQEFFLSCSVGIAVYPGDGTDVDTLIKHASIAMCRAKEMGSHRFQFYSPAMNQRTIERARIAADLRNGLERGEFVLHYQPQVELATGHIVGMEALIRWQHPELGMLSPVRFIGIAEEMDLIVPIGAWVLHTACYQNKAWQDAGLGHLHVAVNLSARQFYQPDLAASITSVLDEIGLPACDLEIELTESLVMTDVEQAVGILNSLKAVGVRISVDDFGTGYSSLSYLKRFPIDILKIDQSFVRDITTNPDDAMIAASIISLAHSLRLQVIAEGVETAAQLSYLRRHGCDQMQGFYFSPPLPGDAFEEMLRQQKCLPTGPDGSAVLQQTLLIVDDEINITAALQRLLRKENYAIVAVQSAMAGLEALALHDVQVILCDQRMPSMTGLEFFRKVKDLYPETIRVMLTGYTELESVIDAINHGAAHRFYTKPWDDDVLRGHIRDAFRQYWLEQTAIHARSSYTLNNFGKSHADYRSVQVDSTSVMPWPTWRFADDSPSTQANRIACLPSQRTSSS